MVQPVQLDGAMKKSSEMIKHSYIWLDVSR